jgi:hypothetical protein
MMQFESKIQPILRMYAISHHPASVSIPDITGDGTIFLFRDG